MHAACPLETPSLRPGSRPPRHGERPRGDSYATSEMWHNCPLTPEPPVTERTLFPYLLAAWTALAAIAFVALLLRPAPYGRYASRGGRRSIPARWGWLVMESPAVVLFVALWAAGRHAIAPAPLAFLFLWLVHYLHRALVYPARMGERGERPMPLEIVASAFAFQLVNVYLNARWLFELAPEYPRTWLADPRFLAGAALFAAGTLVNRSADATLRKPRRHRRLRPSPGRPLPLDLLPQLPGRNRHLVRLGAGDLVARRPLVRPLDDRQPRPPRASAPPVLQRALPRLPRGAQGAGAVRVVNPPATAARRQHRSFQ